jgi:hypothetical protein
VPQAATMMMEVPVVASQPPVQAAPPPQAAPPVQQPAPQAAPPTPHKAPPQAATMMAEAPVLPAPQQVKAPPQAATVMAEAPRVSAAAANAARGNANNEAAKKKGFRETAWFKRGELEEEMARAQAAAGDNPLKSGTTGRHQPLDDAQIEMSQQDAARLSLKTGATQAMPVIKAPHGGLPGERMDEAEMLAEISSPRRTIFIVAAVVLALVIALVLFFAMRGGNTPKAEAPPPTKPAQVAASPPATPTPAATAVTASPSAPSASPSPPSPTPKTPTRAAGGGAPGAELAAAVERVEASGDKREVKRLERMVLVDQKRARLRKDRATEAADRQLMVRLKRVGLKKK